MKKIFLALQHRTINEKIIKRFEEMKERRMLVPKKNMVVCFILLLFDNFNSFK